MLDEWLDQVEQAPDEYEQLRLVSTLGEYPKVKATIGQKPNWARPPHDIAAVRGRLEGACARSAPSSRARSPSRRARRLAWAIAQFTLDEARERQRAGRLEFHDLLVLAREVLRDPEHGWQVRSYLHERYTHLLLDEFQDTDPIQCDLAALLASADPDAATAAMGRDRRSTPGASSSSATRSSRSTASGAPTSPRSSGPVTRSAPRRSTSPATSARSRPVIEFVNHVFADLIDRRPPTRSPSTSRSSRCGVRRRTARRSCSSAPTRTRASRAPTSCGKPRPPTWSARCSPRSATSGRSHDGRPTARESWEPCRLGDICILLPDAHVARPARGRARGRWHPVHGPRRRRWSTARREIRDLLVVLHAVDDPTDELALVDRAALTGVRVRRRRPVHVPVEHHGRWDHQAPLPESLPR